MVLTIIEELMSKKQEEFLDHFARLGVFSKVQALMGSGSDTEGEVIKSQDDISKGAKGKEMSLNFLMIFNFNFFQQQKPLQLHPRMLQKTPKKYCQEKPITGMIGAFVGDAIVCMFGRIQLLLNFPMDQMDGSASFWMEN